MKDALRLSLAVGSGDSGISDGGAGMLQALGARFIDEHSRELPVPTGGGALVSLKQICFRNIHPRLRYSRQEDNVQIEAVCNLKNLLCGDRGVARIYGPQKGATPEQVKVLSLAMETLARLAEHILGCDISEIPGSGASGGLGTGLLLIGARLRARAAAIDEYFRLGQVFDYPWDIVFTAEGTIDSQSSKGKMIGEIARRARERGVRVVAFAGTINHGAESMYEEGVAAYASILDCPMTLEDAIQRTSSLLINTAERTMRMVQIGLSLRSQQLSLCDTAPIAA
ncbi:hypothetical protein HIM_09995 [Hirsutella minnesotensis 3608]|uniref:Glycerate kinase n=1 Tax=Hirsutella minnesotensis 3608 TaxID=1043627 RepID=A0A0F7ZXF0_9HYPO|nr:hypothetical protein HIM_09995 [Hirsutella minnesotensis 3608]